MGKLGEERGAVRANPGNEMSVPIPRFNQTDRSLVWCFCSAGSLLHQLPAPPAQVALPPCQKRCNPDMPWMVLLHPWHFTLVVEVQSVCQAAGLPTSQAPATLVRGTRARRSTWLWLWSSPGSSDALYFTVSSSSPGEEKHCFLLEGCPVGLSVEAFPGRAAASALVRPLHYPALSPCPGELPEPGRGQLCRSQQQQQQRARSDTSTPLGSQPSLQAPLLRRCSLEAPKQLAGLVMEPAPARAVPGG